MTYSRALFTTQAPHKYSAWGWFVQIETKYRICEIIASISTLAGMAIGSTTSIGNDLYLFSQIFWWGLMLSRRMWGLLPLNIVATIIEIWHLFYK